MSQDIVVKFNAFDLAEALLIAERIAAIRSVLRSNKEFVDGVDSFERHYIGALGEVAVCRHFGVPHPRGITAGGDDGSDLVINGWKVQVKCRTFQGKNPELIFRSLDYFKAQVTVATKIESATSIRILGCISKKSFLKLAEQKNYGYGDHYCVDESKLIDVDTITAHQVPVRKAA